MEDKVCCEVKQENTVNSLLKENHEIILNIKSLARSVRENIFGRPDEEKESNPDPQFMIEALDMQNYNLKCIISDLNYIMGTLKQSN